MLRIQVFNRQKARRIRTALLRQAARSLLSALSPDGSELAVHLIDAAEMAALNEKFLGHAGSTDVITFNYQDRPSDKFLCGEIFISVPDAVACAPRFRTTWPSEVVRYLVHGVLHLRGYDDLQPAARRIMKREENRQLKTLSRRFDWGKLEGAKNVARAK